MPPVQCQIIESRRWAGWNERALAALRQLAVDVLRGLRERAGIATDQQASVYQGCLHDKQAAQAELQQNWTAYPAATRENCAQLGGIVGSYVEVLVCIEIKTGNAAAASKSQQPPAAASP
jgi:hypothetical protein